MMDFPVWHHITYKTQAEYQAIAEVLGYSSNDFLFTTVLSQ